MVTVGSNKDDNGDSLLSSDTEGRGRRQYQTNKVKEIHRNPIEADGEQQNIETEPYKTE